VFAARYVLACRRLYLLLPEPKERLGLRVERPPEPKPVPVLRLVAPDLLEGLRLLLPKPEPEGRLVVFVGGVVRTVELPGDDLLMLPVVRKVVRLRSTAGGAL
jgi:hypothetical protein